MSDILCRWINSELKLSKCVEPKSLAADFASGYLIGEVLHKYQLQDDFQHFSKGSTAQSRLNNYTRIEPTLQLLGVPFDVGFAQALMQERPGAATRLLYQLYVLLEKKKRMGLTGIAMETLQPAATARMHRMEREVYNERLRSVVKREADRKLQKISQRYELHGLEMFQRSTKAVYAKQQELQKVHKDRRLKATEQHRLARGKQYDIMVKIQSTATQLPKAPTKQSLHPLEHEHKDQKQREAQDVQREIAQFERNLKKQLAANSLSSSEGLRPEEVALTNSEYIQKIRQRLEEDAAAREGRGRRRRQALMGQLQAHEDQQEAIRDEQLLARMTRQTKEERRAVVQLMQMRQQKEVLRQNRIFRERQYQERRLRDFQEALDREAALTRQARLERADELRREKELHDRIAAERVQARHKKHVDACRGILGQMVDLATRVGESRLLTGNQIPAKLMQEWKELFFHGMPLYDGGAVETPASEPTQEQAREMEKLDILNNQDYDEYTSLMGEWAWPEGGAVKNPPPNNYILAHVVNRLQAIIDPPTPDTPPSFFQGFTLKACVLGKAFAGKSTCLARISQTHGIHVLSASLLVQEALRAFQTELGLGGVLQETEKAPESSVSPSEDCERAESDAGKEEDSGSSESGPVSQHAQQHTAREKDSQSELSLKPQLGESAEKILRKGKPIPDELLVEIIVEAIRQVPSESGWILDGFPTHLNQAKLLEKRLSGFNPDNGTRKTQNRESNLVVDPHSLKEATSPPPVLDVVLLLDVSDELVLDRAAKRAFKQGSSGPDGVECGTEAVPAIEDGPLTNARPTDQALPPRENDLEMSQVQHRIAAFHGNWSKLEKWYSRRQNILVRVNAEDEPNVVFKNVESILYKAMLQRVDGGSCHALSGTSLTASAPEDPHGISTSHHELSVNQSEEPVYMDEPLPKEIPEYLAPHWQNVCTSYVTNVKTVMQNLRGQRNLIIQHLYNIKEDFKQYLKRPDLKQEFVAQWQQDYNDSIPQDMRCDEETKAEIHLRLEELKERLWDICDRHREEALQEQAAIKSDGWMEDHTAMLVNHFAALVQVELDRFQDTVLLLRDYYKGMLGPVLPEPSVQFVHVPMLDITENEGTVQAENLTNSAQSGRRDGEERQTKIIPMISPRPLSTEPEAKLDSTNVRPEEKLLECIWQTALTAVSSMVSLEVQHREAEENEEAQHQGEREGQQGAVELTATFHSAKDKKKPGKRKDPPSPAQEPSPCPPVEEDEKQVRRRTVRAQIRQEHAMALDIEDSRVKARLELIKARALSVVRNLHRQAQDTYQAMQEDLGTRFLAEMTSIDKLVEMVGQHIESGSQIHFQLVLEGPDFFIDGNKRVVPCPVPPLRPPPCELPAGSTLTVLQLRALHAQFYKVAPEGQLCVMEFSEILQGLISQNVSSDALPKLWMHLSQAQVLELISAMSRDSELLDWRQFLLSAAQPWPVPTQAQLLEALARFLAADPQGTGFVTEESYLQTDLWFPSDRKLPSPDDPYEPQPYDRLDNLRKFFFTLFADHAHSPACLDYETMLLYFSMHPDRVQGWVRALSVVTGRPLRHRPHRAPLLKSVPYIEEVSDDTQPEGDREPNGSEDGGTVSIPALLKVACHGGPGSSTHSRFHPKWRKREEYEEDFRRIFEDLGFGVDEEVPFTLLSQLPLLQELMENSMQHQLTDIHGILQAQLGDRESHSQLPMS